jgi:tRNA(Arg) A34 adenosine deaminase TadA
VASPTGPEEELLASLIEDACRWALSGRGGPFAAAVARDGVVFGRAHNEVVERGDPSAHAEMLALREAAQALGTHDLSGCVVFTTCEPCPMCLGAAFWARVDRIVYAASRQDAAASGFDDEVLYREVAAPLDERCLPMVRALPAEGRRPFDAWDANPNRQAY